MIERYAMPEMSEIWSDRSRFAVWLEIEILACEAQAQLGKIPKSAVTQIKKRAGFDVDRIHAIEAEVNHDVIAFLTAVGEKVGEPSRYIHYGLTSSDILDTALSVQIQKAGRCRPICRNGNTLTPARKPGCCGICQRGTNKSRACGQAGIANSAGWSG